MSGISGVGAFDLTQHMTPQTPQNVGPPAYVSRMVVSATAGSMTGHESRSAAIIQRDGRTTQSTTPCLGHASSGGVGD